MSDVRRRLHVGSNDVRCKTHAQSAGGHVECETPATERSLADLCHMACSRHPSHLPETW